MHIRFHPYYPMLFALLAAALAMAIQGTWGVDIAHHWAFISIMAITILLSAWQSFRHHHGNYTGNVLAHAGFAILIITMMAGVPWNESGKAVATTDGPANIFYTSEGHPLVSPFSMQLGNMDVTYYEDGKHVKQYSALLRLLDLTYTDTTFHVVTASVNHPAKFMDYRLYLDSYDVENQQFAVIKISKEPLLPIIYIAMALMAIGAILQIVHHWKNQSKWLWICAIVMTLIFTALSVIRIQFGHLMPALRSGWFIPHLAFYMIAYSLLACALVLVVIKHYRGDSNHHTSNAISSLLHTSSSLLLLGMLCGAIWAKQAWGDYWAWDPKECWAAATWLLSLAATHSTRASKSPTKAKLRIIMMILCFLAMQFTWYGVNYLPSAKDSIHTYNTK